MSKCFNVVIYTASLSKYAEPLIDTLDPNNWWVARLYREHCTVWNNVFIKDLIFLGLNLKDTIIVDNSPNSYAFQIENAIPITSWYNDKSDNALHILMPILKKLLTIDDVRPLIPKLIKEFHNKLDKNCLDSSTDQISSSDIEAGHKGNPKFQNIPTQ